MGHSACCTTWANKLVRLTGTPIGGSTSHNGPEAVDCATSVEIEATAALHGREEEEEEEDVVEVEVEVEEEEEEEEEDDEADASPADTLEIAVLDREDSAKRAKNHVDAGSVNDAL
jgi:hypothetical protein